jgi:hypothetical protein
MNKFCNLNTNKGKGKNGKRRDLERENLEGEEKR